VTPDDTEGTAEEQNAPPPEPADGAPPAEGTEPLELSHEAVIADLERVTAERDQYLDQLRRTQADFENYRKRMARENAAAAERGAGRLAKELLPALDHLEIALKAAEAHTAPAAAGADEQRTPAQGGHEDVIRGFVMVRDELMSALGKVGIESFSPHGEAFDPSEHEAMAQLPVEEAESGTVVEVYQQGYRINGTVLRPARVVVAQ